MNGLIRIFALTVALITVGSSMTRAGLSVSTSYDFLPYQNIDEPIRTSDSALVDDAQVQLKKSRVGIEYPVVFSQGRTILLNNLSYQNIEFGYRHTQSILKRLHRVGYSLTLMHHLSDKWSLLSIVNPSLASDFKAGLTSEDLSFQTAVIADRHFSEKLSIGLGVAYSTQFGSAVPLPLLMMEWNDGGKWSFSMTLPSNLEFWYQAGQSVKLGLLISGDGDNYYFDPQGFQVERPELRYTMMTLGPAAKIDLSSHLQLNIEAGIIGLHRFEFYSGDEEVVSNDLEPSHYVRLGLQTNL